LIPKNQRREVQEDHAAGRRENRASDGLRETKREARMTEKFLAVGAWAQGRKGKLPRKFPTRKEFEIARRRGLRCPSTEGDRGAEREESIPSRPHAGNLNTSAAVFTLQSEQPREGERRESRVRRPKHQKGGRRLTEIEGKKKDRLCEGSKGLNGGGAAPEAAFKKRRASGDREQGIGPPSKCRVLTGWNP